MWQHFILYFDQWQISNQNLKLKSEEYYLSPVNSKKTMFGRHRYVASLCQRCPLISMFAGEMTVLVNCILASIFRPISSRFLLRGDCRTSQKSFVFYVKFSAKK